MTGGAWAPLRVRAFRWLWTGQLVSNIGTWMFVVGAQWQVADESGAVLVGLVQTATSLPVLLLAAPSGWLGDVLDRRRLLLATNLVMLTVSATLGVVTICGLGRPWVILLGTALLGVGTALLLPTWQAVIPSLVGREQITQAAALGGMSINMARAVGPAVGGVAVAFAGPGWVFLLNAASFAAVVAAAWRWRPEARTRPAVRPHWAGGFAVVRSSPAFRRVLMTIVSFALPASAMWALLPILAREELNASSAHYGVLMAAGGLGAVTGAALLPRMRRLLTPRGTLSAAFALAGTGSGSVLGWGGLPSVVPLVATFTFGVGWLMVMASLNAAAHAAISDEVRARGMSVYVMASHGGQALGGLTWGAMAAWLGGTSAVAVAAGGLLVGALVLRSAPVRLRTDAGSLSG